MKDIKDVNKWKNNLLLCIEGLILLRYPFSQTDTQIQYDIIKRNASCFVVVGNEAVDFKHSKDLIKQYMTSKV